MHLHLQNPYPLLAAILPLAALFIRPKKLLLPALAILLIAFALTAPTLIWSAAPDRIILLLDLSGSTRNSSLRSPAYIRQLAQQNLPPQCRLTIVAFASTQKILLSDISPADADHWPSAWEPLATDKPTDIPAALSWRAPGETDSTLLPRWLLTDGLTAPIQPPPTMQLAITLIPPQPDLAITDLLHTSNGNLLAHLRSTASSTAALTLTRNDTSVSTEQLSLTPNEDRWITLHDPLPATSPTLYKLELHRTPTPDIFPENDTASLLYTPPGPPQLLEITKPSEAPTNLSTLLQSQTQAVLLHDNVTLSPQSILTLENFVKDSGGGLLLLGSHFPPQIQALSPLTPDNPTRLPLHLTFLLDASGSMNESVNAESKIHLAARAIAGTLPLLHDTDHLTLITFSSDAQLQIDSAAKDFAQALEQKNLTATGPTNPDAALPLLKQQLTPPTEKQIILLLTDGQIPALNIPQWKSLLTPPTTTFLLIAPDTAGPLKELLTQPNTHWLSTNDPSQWQSLLPSALAAELAPRARHDDLLWHTLLNPPITGKTNAWTELHLAPDSQALATGVDQNKINWPLAALAHRGLGHVAALNTNDLPPQLLTYLLNQIAAPEGDPRFTVTTTHINGGYHLTINAINNQQFLNTESPQLRILSQQPQKQIPIPLNAPGKYEIDLQTFSPLSAVVIRTDEKGSEHLVARVEPAKVETTEWPATVERQVENPADAVSKTGEMKIQKGYIKGYFTVEFRQDLGRFSWGLGVVLLLAAMALGRR